MYKVGHASARKWCYFCVVFTKVMIGLTQWSQVGVRGVAERKVLCMHLVFAALLSEPSRPCLAVHTYARHGYLPFRFW